MLMESNHKALARFTRSNRVLTALEIESAEKVASGFMIIPPPGRCRLGQGLNLQLPSFDGRVFRSNRTLTATEKFFWEKYRRRSLEPFLSSVFTDDRRSYLQTACRRPRGCMVAKYLHPHCPERETGRKSTKVC